MMMKKKNNCLKLMKKDKIDPDLIRDLLKDLEGLDQEVNLDQQGLGLDRQGDLDLKVGLGLDPGLKVGPEVGPDPRVDRGRGPDLKVGQDLVQVHLAVQDPGRKVPLQGLIKSVHFVSF